MLPALAAGVTPAGAVTSELARSGLLGALVLALGVLAYRLILRETARADRAEAALRELEREAREQMVKALIESANANRDTTQAVRDMLAALRERDRG